MDKLKDGISSIGTFFIFDYLRFPWKVSLKLFMKAGVDDPHMNDTKILI